MQNNYKAVQDALTDEERTHIQQLREEREAGGEGKYNHYGHDLSAAISRGYWRKVREAASDLLLQIGLASGYGERHGHHRMEFGLGLNQLIQAAGKNGVTAEDVRRTMQKRLDVNPADSMSIESMVEDPDKPRA